MSRAAFFLLFVAVAYVALCEGGVCGPNEVFKVCASKCEPACNKEPVYCIEVCEEPGCQCEPGFLRSAEGKCVLTQNC